MGSSGSVASGRSSGSGQSAGSGSHALHAQAEGVKVRIGLHDLMCEGKI